MKRILIVFAFLLYFVSNFYGQDTINDLFTIKQIDTLQCYYLIYVSDSINKTKKLLSLKNFEVNNSKVLKKIEVDSIYRLYLEPMNGMFLDEERKDFVYFPHSTFFIDEKLISTAYQQPFKPLNLRGLYINPCTSQFATEMDK